MGSGWGPGLQSSGRLGRPLPRQSLTTQTWQPRSPPSARDDPSRPATAVPTGRAQSSPAEPGGPGRLEQSQAAVAADSSPSPDQLECDRITLKPTCQRRSTRWHGLDTGRRGDLRGSTQRTGRRCRGIPGCRGADLGGSRARYEASTLRPGSH